MDEKMNKKGAVMFWVIPIFVAAIAIYLLYSGTFSLVAEPKGTWQLEFLNKNYLEAEKVILTQNSIVKNIGLETAWELAENSGFLKNQKSECGIQEGTNLWNNKDKSCFPNVKENVIKLVEEKLKIRIKENIFSEINYQGKILKAKGGEFTIKSSVGTYIYDTSFAVDLGFSFDEYNQLWKTSVGMINSCRGASDLKLCLDNEKPDYWKYSSCDPSKENFLENKKKVKFCVVSPDLTFLLFSTGKKDTLTYNIALDFTATSSTSQTAELSKLIA